MLVPDLTPHMPKAPRHTPPRQDWRRYAETARKPRSAASLGDMMRQCNRDAWNKTYRAQVSSEYWEDECQEFSFMDLPRRTRFIRYAVATLILLPLALITAMSLCDQPAHASGSLNILFSIPVWYALMGAAVWVVLGNSRLFPSSLLYLYVLGHEPDAHALAVICSHGSIHAFKADLDGGYIRRTKTTSLSPFPYFPSSLGHAGQGLVWGVTYLFWPTVTCQAILYSGLGFWWCFHLFWTAWIIPKGPAGPVDNGTFFSLILVYFANLLLFLALLRLFNAVSLHAFWRIASTMRKNCAGRSQGPPRHAGCRAVPVKNILFLTRNDERQKEKRNQPFNRKEFPCAPHT